MEAIAKPTRRLRFSAGTCLILAAWLAVFGPRPFQLGFYIDDWRVLLCPLQEHGRFTWGLLHYYVSLYLNRPLLGLETYLFASLCGESAVLWHIGLAILMLASALALRRMCRSLLELAGWPASAAADWAAVAWLTFPWTIGATGWPTLGVTSLGLICFALCGDVLFRKWREGEQAWLLPVSLILCSGLTYEAFYGQWLAYLLIGWACGVRFRRMLPATVAFSLAQVAMISWNRLVHLGWVRLSAAPAPSKSFCADWFIIARQGLSQLPAVLESAREVASPLLIVSAVFAGACALVIAWGLIRHSSRERQGRAVLLVAACGIGALISIVLMSFATYSLAYLGPDSRTTMAPSFWLAVALAVILSPFFSGNLPVRLFGSGLMLGLCGLLGYASYIRVTEWGDAWEIEQQVLAAAPAQDLAAIGPDTWVVYAGPTIIHKWTYVFAQWFDTNFAVRYMHPAVKHSRILPARADCVTTWDGVFLEQGNPSPIHRIKTPKVLVWDYPAPRLRQAEPPLILPSSSAVLLPPSSKLLRPFMPSLEACLVRYGPYALISYRVDCNAAGLNLVTYWQKQGLDEGRYVVAAHLVNRDSTFFLNMDHYPAAGPEAFAQLEVGDVLAVYTQQPPGEWCEKAEYVDICLYDVNALKGLPCTNIHGLEPWPGQSPRIRLPRSGAGILATASAPAE